jgi:hypothetical protein
MEMEALNNYKRYQSACSAADAHWRKLREKLDDRLRNESTSRAKTPAIAVNHSLFIDHLVGWVRKSSQIDHPQAAMCILGSRNIAVPEYRRRDPTSLCEADS